MPRCVGDHCVVRYYRSCQASQGDPQFGHNRWHSDIPAIVEVDLGEEVIRETRDASDSQIQPA
ncbi:MAG: hypothetical protein F4X66_06485 [Chloroflexi bacterium]|nr:hypothetical protein [Chloroflexota bacterium]